MLQVLHTALVAQLCQLLRVHAQQKVLLILDNADGVLGCNVRATHKQRCIAVSVSLTFNTCGPCEVMYLPAVEVGACCLEFQLVAPCSKAEGTHVALITVCGNMMLGCAGVSECP